jgi:hypothetical protein
VAADGTVRLDYRKFDEIEPIATTGLVAEGEGGSVESTSR